MAEDASALEHEMERTRERMGDTIEALADKADGPAHLVEAVHDRIHSVTTTIGEMMNDVNTAVAGAGGTMSDTLQAGTRNGGDLVARTRERLTETVANVNANVGDRLGNADVPGSARRAAGVVQGNPLGLALGALAVGFLAGSILPISETERTRLKPIGDKLAGQAQAAANDLIAAGKAVAVETAQAAVAAARASAKMHGQEVVDAAKARG
jgi:ElaB/YqjD/DUF883 family membrane-anchored ribosome-binding protein